MTQIDRESFIFGEPLDTQLGEVRFLKYHEYLTNLSELSLMSLNVLHIYYQYQKDNVNNDAELNQVLEELKKTSLFDIVKANRSFGEAYLKIFSLVLKETESIVTLFENEELFMNMRQLIIDMNMITESEVSENPEIQAFIEKSNRVKQKNNEKLTASDIASSIVVGTSHSYGDVANMTVLQFYSTFYRMAAIYNYNTSALFATVAEKVSIEAWNKHIDLFEAQTAGISNKEFSATYGNMF